MFLAIEIGGTKLQIVIGDASGRITHRARYNIDAQLGGEGIRAQIAKALPELIATYRPAAIGVGFGGPVDGATGRICCSHQVAGWHDFPLGEWVRKESGLPVVVENDSNCATLGEAVCGAGKGLNPVFYFNMGSGVGGGLAVGGRIYHGICPGEVEFGHLQLDRLGTIVEECCSGWAVDRKIRSLQETDPTSLLCRMIGEKHGGEARHLSAALAQGDAAAKRILAEAATDLGYALSHVVHLFHPAVLVMGGGLAQVGEPLRVAVEAALEPHVMEAFLPPPPVRLAGLGEDAVPVGALLLAAQSLVNPGAKA